MRRLLALLALLARSPLGPSLPLQAALVVTLVAAPVWADGADGRQMSAGFRPVQKLLDLSGLVWIDGDTFLAVHDAKFPDERRRVRVSLLRLPASLDGVEWKPLRPRFPGRPSSDLESAARIPGTRKMLLVESGDDASGLDRIYLADASQHDVRILDAVEWSSFTDVFNVEGTAVAQSGDGYLFIWAERNEGDDTTLVRWTDLGLVPFAIGASGVVSSASFTLPTDLAALYNRPLVGIEVDASGELFTVAAFDPDSDDGPYRSAILSIGRVSGGGIVLDADPSVVGTLDGLKVESLTLRETDGTRELFFGTDDENYGGTLRPLPLAP
jgi:hypothetical protein